MNLDPYQLLINRIRLNIREMEKGGSARKGFRALGPLKTATDEMIYINTELVK